MMRWGWGRSCGGNDWGSGRSRRRRRRPQAAIRGGEPLEPRQVLAAVTHVEFSVSDIRYGACAAVPYGQRTIAVPEDLVLPVSVSIRGAVDDELLIDGQVAQVGPSVCNGAHAVDYSFRLDSPSFELACGDNYGVAASYNLDITFAPADVPPENQPPSPLDPGNDGVPCKGGCPIDDDRTSHDVNLATGLLAHRDGTTLSSMAAGIGGDTAFEWAGTAAGGTDQRFGNGWIMPGMPQLQALATDEAGPTRVAIPFSSSDVRVFDRSDAEGTAYVSASGTGSRDTLVKEGSRFVFRTSTGDTLAFADISSDATGSHGQFLERSDAAGNRLVATLAADGTLSQLDSFPAGSTQAAETQAYETIPSEAPNAGKVARIDVRRSGGTVVRSTRYAYYEPGSDAGAAGDLKSITVLDGDGAVLDLKQYRYAVAPVAGRKVSLLLAVLDGEGSRRLAEAGVNFDTAGNADIKPYARDWYLYDQRGRVVRHDMQGAGCSACTAGIGTFSYSYTTNPIPVGAAPNAWQTRTVETRPDGTESITYANARGQTMLNVIRETVSGTPRQWGTFSRYDANGLKIWEAEPSSLLLPADLADLERHADLVNVVADNCEYVSDDAGLIRFTDYFLFTTATDKTPGGVARFMSATGVRHGELGADVVQESFTWLQRTAGDRTSTVPATQTTYAGERCTGAATTSYAYVWREGTTQPLSVIVSLPVVSRDENGPGMPASITHVYDAVGRETWTRDADGFITYRQYDAGTNAVVKTITDVSTARTADFQDLPAGWATPAGGGLHLVATTEVDRLGRPTKAVDPAGSVTWLVYDDVGRAVRTYAGWNAAAGTTTGPITVTRSDVSGTYRESLSFSAPAAVADGRPTGTEAIENLQALTRWTTNAAGQVVAVDGYFDLDGLVWTPAAALGTEGINFLRTRYAYNNQGNVSRVQSPAGTITRSVYDGQSRLTGTWVGTDDTTANGYTWTPANATGTSDLVRVAAYEYDDGGTGDGNLTRIVELPGTADGVTADARVTQHAYDWRDRRVATKTGAEATPALEGGGVNRPLVWIVYDNLDRPVRTGLYDGDGVVPAAVAAPPVALLRGLHTTAYDAQGRIFRGGQFAVDQSTGLIGPAVETNQYRDRRGNVVLSTVPNGPATQSRYDGAGRLVASYTLGKVPAATWAAATSLSASVVLEQHEYLRDAAGNAILDTVRQRFHDASPTATGPLGSPTSGIRARVWFVASYYDDAHRLTAVVDVGTNGGRAFARPASVPGRAATALVTSFAYDAAGHLQDLTDPRGVVSRTLHDALGRTTATIDNFTGGAAGAQADVTTLLRYDAAGRLASRTAFQPAGIPSQTTSYIYGVSLAEGSGLDSNDILAATVYPDPLTGLPAESSRDTVTVNALGEPVTIRDRNGTLHAYDYDVAGRPTADSVVVLGAGVDGTILRLETSYDAAGRAVTLTSYDAAAGGAAAKRNQVQRTYNAFGQVVREAQSHVGAVTSSTPAVRYGFTAGAAGNHSRLTTLTYPDGRTLTMVYAPGIDAAASRPSRIQGQAAGAGQAAGTAQAIVLEAFRYLGAGTVVERSHPEVNLTLTAINPSGTAGAGGDKYTGFDRFGRVADQRWVRSGSGGATDVDRVLYAYDRTGNPTRRITPLAAAFSESFSYDGLGQLTSMARRGGAGIVGQSWQFDALGNWQGVSTGGTAQSRTANARNEITAVGGRPLAYDAAGNLLVDDSGRRFVYDAWNRLVQVGTATGGVIARYEYDPLGQRIVQRTGAGPTAAVRDFYFSTQWQVLEERVRTAEGLIPAAANTQYVWSPVSADALIERDRNTDALAATGVRGLEQRIYVVQDATWNTTALVAAAGVPGVATGAVINRFAYTAYGEMQVLSASWARGAAAVSWQYLHQGLRFETATGLASARNRDYSPSLGRFLERDPLGFKAGDNNVYRFVGNAPIGRTDPSGLCEPSRSWTQEDQAAKDRATMAYYNDSGLLADLGINYDRSSGFAAALYRAADGTFYLAFRGTEGLTNVPDLTADGMQGMHLPTPQYDEAIELAKAVKRVLGPNAKLILTGHSLGGGLAAAASFATGLDAIIFNPPWLNFYYSWGSRGNIRTHITCGDFLSAGRTLLFPGRRPPGTIFLHPPRKLWTHGSLDTHGMANFPELY